jgi:Tol biopolymer transport system component
VECCRLRCMFARAAVPGYPLALPAASRKDAVTEPAAPPLTPVPEGPADRLDSWKDIATFFRRDVSTVQRWEKREGMPVHRHLHDKLGSVYAFRAELDAWSQSRSLRVGQGDDLGEAPPPVQSIESATYEQRVVVPEPVFEDSNGAAGVKSGPLGGVSTRSPRGRRSPFTWLTLTAGAILAAGTAVWLLRSADYFWQNPLADAQFQVVTDFEGTEQAAAISRDGKFIAFLADRDGPVDVWVTQVGASQYHNLTHGSIRELTNPSVRTVSFSPDAALVSFWVRESDASKAASIAVWTVPTMGGQLRPYLKGVAEFDWSSDGTRLVYHTPGPGDPLFVRDPGQSADRQIFEAPPGLHAHFPVWSPDGSFIYFVQGALPDKMDIWRIRPAGGIPERITDHNSHVSHPVFLNPRTLLYLTTTVNGSRAAFYTLDIERRVPHRASFGLEQYTSLGASADGRRLVATVTNTKGTLWRVPISDQVAEESAASRITLPTAGGVSPRLGPNFLLYVSSRAGTEGIWKLGDGKATELWSAREGRIFGGPSIAQDGRRIAFVVGDRGRTRLCVMDDDGTNLRALTESMELHGAPAWAPDGASIIVAAYHDGAPKLFRVSMDGRTAGPLVLEHSIDPVWSPDGQFLAYSGPDVGTTFQVKTVTADGRPYPVPNLRLTRGARRLAFLPGRRALVVLRGEIEHKNFWLIDLETGTERQLTNFGLDFTIRDFDLSSDGQEIVFDRVRENSDIVLIDRRPR